MSAEIQDATDAQVTLVAGSGGVFDVRRDGELIFSKHHTGRFPAVGEIMQLV
ncbi:MAG: hypothetical protein H7A04_14500 [Pseudomonadales bacterium]|nr:hypothetical protein [Pseudomonadales bacterium]